VHLSQPALTRSIQVAESLLGVRLFDRSRSGVEPTSFGRLVIDRARFIVGEIHELEREVGLQRGLASGDLAVTLAPYPGALSGQLAVARLLGEFPGISCRVQVGDWMRATRDVLDGTVDLGVADAGVASGDSRLRVETLSTRPLCFVCRPGHMLLGRRDLGIDDLAEFPWAATRAPARMRAFLPGRVGPCGRWDERSGDFIPAIETDVMSDFAVLARESDALVVCALSMVATDLEAGRVAVLSFSAPWFRLNYGVIQRQGRTLPPAAEQFIRIIRGIEAELEEREAMLRERFVPR
jgi:DNA-binding transcriptional LysR family regulator